MLRNSLKALNTVAMENAVELRKQHKIEIFKRHLHLDDTDALALYNTAVELGYNEFVELTNDLAIHERIERAIKSGNMREMVVALTMLSNKYSLYLAIMAKHGEGAYTRFVNADKGVNYGHTFS